MNKSGLDVGKSLVIDLDVSLKLRRLCTDYQPVPDNGVWNLETSCDRLVSSYREPIQIYY